MNKQRPFIVTFIGDMTILGAVFIIATLFPGFSERFGIDFGASPVYSLSIVIAMMAIIFLISAFGFLKLKKWGYWLMVGMNIFFLLLHIILSLKLGLQPSVQDLLQGVISLLFIVPTKKYFDGIPESI